MKKYILGSLLMACLLLTFVFISCDYREYADADYPDTKVYLPMAFNDVWYINEANNENASMLTPGGPQSYMLDKANNKFIVLMSVIQSGVRLKSFSVDISVDHSLVNTLIAKGDVFPVGTVPLPESAYTLPGPVKVDSRKQSALFNMDIKLDALTGDNAGKKFAIAVKIDTSAVEVSEGLDTAIICIDTTFLEDLL